MFTYKIYNYDYKYNYKRVFFTVTKGVFLLQSASTAPTQPTPQGNKNRLRHHKVVARNEVDGFYYPGLVRKCINPRYVEVEFDGFERQVVGVRYVIPIEGARPCPSLKVSFHTILSSSHELDPLSAIIVINIFFYWNSELRIVGPFICHSFVSMFD